MENKINTPLGIGVTEASFLTDKTIEYRDLAEPKNLTENKFQEYLNNALYSSQSIHRNLKRAANLVISFKQVAVDQKQDEIRKFHIKSYIDEVLLVFRPSIKG